MQPILTSPRLRLRPFTLADAPEVRRLAGVREVAEPTAAIPHPYPEGAAEAWIVGQPALFAARRAASYAVCRADDGRLLGAMSLVDLQLPDLRAEVGYWIGLEHWGRGWGSEALGLLIGWAETELQISRFVGRCLASNLGSARVLEKSGFEAEGRQRLQVRRGGRFEDMLLFGRCSPARAACR